MIREEALRWFEEGNSDIATARILLDNKKYNPSAFYSQQAAEKILKGLLLAHNEASWGHSVLTLLRRFVETVDVDVQEVEQCAKELDRHYIPSRYPDAYPSGRPEDYYTEKIAKEALSCALKNKRVRGKQDDAIKDALQDYCEEVIKRFKPLCIILYGSRAKGTFTNKSDVDIIVISNAFDQDFLSRIMSLIDANTTKFPIEPLGYTEDEFENMLESCRLTALDAVKEGIALFGEDYFNSLKNKLSELEKKGIYKGKTSWHVPAEAVA